MKFLVDANLSPHVVDRLRAAGHDATHVAEVGLLTASDAEIFLRATSDGFTIITADTDFPMLLALHRRTATPSVVLLRGVAHESPDVHAELLIANLPAVAADLEQGAIVSLRRDRVRIRDLPFQ